jgi:uncharacterized membrane protein
MISGAPRTTRSGVPVHRVLAVFPLGLLGTSCFFDLAWMVVGKAELASVARWLIAAGVAGGAIAAAVGLLDWRRIPTGSEARRLGALHGTANLLVEILFAVSWFLRDPRTAGPPSAALALSTAGLLLLLVTAWMGGELAEKRWMVAGG